MPINAHPDYIAAEKEYAQAQTLEEKIEKLKKMISLSPGHKGAENLRAQLKTRLKKLTSQQEKIKKSGKSSQKGIKKEDLQIVIVGLTNSGKSSLLSALTNTYPKISEIPFTTKEPIIGMLKFKSINMQIIENPSINSEHYDKGLTNSADTLIILGKNLEEIKKVEDKIGNPPGKKIIVINMIHPYALSEIRKIKARLNSQRYKDYSIIDAETKLNLEDLTLKMFKNFDKIRIYTKEPNKKEKSPRPIIMKQDSTVAEVAEKILKGFSKNVQQTKIWGPSSKFPGQIVGLKHKLKDLDVVEFKTR